ncbi:hypothetical protein EDD17DRAFT_1638443, partial [Pisolithus thermaeus]
VVVSTHSSPSVYDAIAQSEKTLTFKPSARVCKLTSLLSISAYTAFFFLVSIHIATYRLLPNQAAPLTWSSSDVDLHSLGSAEVVKTVMKTWPGWSWMLCIGFLGCELTHTTESSSVMGAQYITLYAGLVSCGLVHATEGPLTSVVHTQHTRGRVGL